MLENISSLIDENNSSINNDYLETKLDNDNLKLQIKKFGKANI